MVKKMVSQNKTRSNFFMYIENFNFLLNIKRLTKNFVSLILALKLMGKLVKEERITCSYIENRKTNNLYTFRILSIQYVIL
ncbi:hypothetical protein D2M30_0551 [Bacillus amyloliquefaciens]|nr:hypothetical protein D2M30_0551 [Bacillus amyloliquefaciens]